MICKLAIKHLHKIRSFFFGHHTFKHFDGSINILTTGFLQLPDENITKCPSTNTLLDDHIFMQYVKIRTFNRIFQYGAWNNAIMALIKNLSKKYVVPQNLSKICLRVIFMNFVNASYCILTWPVTVKGTVGGQVMKWRSWYCFYTYWLRITIGFRITIALLQ